MMKRVGILLGVITLALLTILPGCGSFSMFSTNAAGKSAWVRITWTESSSGVTGYDVYRGTAPGGPYQHLAGPLTGSIYIDYAVNRGRVYYYVMTATSGVGISSYSNELKATP